MTAENSKKCLHCGLEFYRKKKHGSRQWAGIRFCSLSCATKENYATPDRVRREAEIVEMLRDGVSHRKIAAKFQMAYSLVSRVGRANGFRHQREATKRDALLTRQRLQELISYNPETGEFVRIVPTPDAVIGTLNAGYLMLSIDGRQHRAHRLAWLYMYGEWPSAGLDHINGVRSDNRISNLREATQAQNVANSGLSKTNKSGAKGVLRRGEKWLAKFGGKHLGTFQTLEEARQAHQRVAREKYGEFARILP